MKFNKAFYSYIAKDKHDNPHPVNSIPINSSF